MPGVFPKTRSITRERTNITQRMLDITACNAIVRNITRRQANITVQLRLLSVARKKSIPLLLFGDRDAIIKAGNARRITMKKGEP